MVEQRREMVSAVKRCSTIDEQLAARSLHHAVILRVEFGAAAYAQNATPREIETSMRVGLFLTKISQPDAGCVADALPDAGLSLAHQARRKLDHEPNLFPA